MNRHCSESGVDLGRSKPPYRTADLAGGAVALQRRHRSCPSPNSIAPRARFEPTSCFVTEPPIPRSSDDSVVPRVSKRQTFPATKSKTCFATVDISHSITSCYKKQVESVGSPEAAHRAYNEFLRQFPLCFGYWKKVSSRVLRIFQLYALGRGLRAHFVPCSCGKGSAIDRSIRKRNWLTYWLAALPTCSYLPYCKHERRLSPTIYRDEASCSDDS